MSIIITKGIKETIGILTYVQKFFRIHKILFIVVIFRNEN